MMIKITREKWNSIDSDFKGEWKDYYGGDHPEWVGKKTVMSTCITENPNELCQLLVEGVHFEIMEDTPPAAAKKTDKDDIFTAETVTFSYEDNEPDCDVWFDVPKEWADNWCKGNEFSGIEDFDNTYVFDDSHDMYLAAMEEGTLIEARKFYSATGEHYKTVNYQHGDA